MTRLRPLLPVGVLVAALLLVPAVFTRVPFYTMSTAVQMAILAIATAGLTLLMGHAGQISIGQAAFFGIGAYASAILTTRAALPPLAALVAGVALSCLVAWLVGRLIFRVSGHYLALATLAFGLMLGYLARQLSLTGGASGIVDIPRLAIGSFVLRGDLRYYYLAAGVLVVVLVLSRNLVGSLFGRSLVALGDSEIAAASAGVDTARHKRVVFVIAAAFASVAGSLYAHWVTFVDYHTLDLLLSLQLLIMATVGGLRSVWGAPIGAFIVLTLSQAAREVLPEIAPNVGGDFEIAVYGIALILVLLFLPHGVAGGLRALVRSRSAS
jgi:branched-chain amino acid transport system permease protein